MLTVIYQGRPIVHVACGEVRLSSSVDALEIPSTPTHMAM
jgi:hypothetical protein